MDPIAIFRTNMQVKDFLLQQKNDRLNLSPYFQRRSVWTKNSKSLLIDTVVRGRPIPIVFLRDIQTESNEILPMREVVDGQQRIRTLTSFIDPNLIKDFDFERDEFVVKKFHNSEIANKTFSQLDQKTKDKILDYQFSVHVLPSDVDDREILQIFARLNSTGMKLTAQELRNALYHGKFKTSMYNLSYEHLHIWRKWNVFTNNQIATMAEVEFTSEFAHMILNGITAKTKATLDNLYEDYEDEYPPMKEVERRFRIIMESIETHFGENIRDLPFKNKTLFYILFAIFYHIQFSIKSELKSKKPSAISKDVITKISQIALNIKARKAPRKVVQAYERRTTDLRSRIELFDHIFKNL